MFSIVLKKLLGFDPAAIFIAIFIALIGFVGIANYDKVLGVFGYETRAVLKEKLKQADVKVEVITAVNDSNQTTVKVLEHTAVNIDKTLSFKITEDKISEKRTTEIKKVKDKKIDEILTVQDKPEETKEKEISEVQITSLWDSYCDTNVNNKCAANTAG